MYVKQHYNIDGFNFQRLFKDKIYSRFGYTTYTGFLLVSSFVNNNFINVYNINNVTNLNYIDYLDHFAITYDELKFRRL